MTMRIWPAIDLRGGKCVRLVQGDYDRETVFGDDPVAMARRWSESGAQCLHLVDLDGAKDGRRVNADAVRGVRKAVSIPLQLGGGVRDAQAIEELLGLGVDRLVVGTAAVKDPAWFASMCEAHPGRLVLGLDARDGQVATDGWRSTSSVAAVDLLKEFASAPLAGVVATDIARDGMLEGPNIESLRAFIEQTPHELIASGGVTTAEDVRRVAALGAGGCIIGRSLYEGLLSLEDALAAASQ